jgi:hypothetical protein
VLNIAYNTLCGGQRLQDIEARRCDAVYLDGLGTESLALPARFRGYDWQTQRECGTNTNPKINGHPRRNRHPYRSQAPPQPS